MGEIRPEKALAIEGEVIRPETVHFDSLDAAILKDVADGQSEPVEVTGELFLPDTDLHGPGPYPAVVIVQGLGGQKHERELTYGHKFAEAGYAALALDSMGARGKADIDDKWKALSMTTWSLLADVYGALRFLSAHERVDARAISVMGFSWGGMVSVLCAYEQITRAYLGDSAERFAGHIGYYGCSIARLEDPQTSGAPVLMMIGAHDENVSVERTRQIRDDLRRGGSDADLEVFDGYHQWDGKDREIRHVFGSLADIRIRITAANEMCEERSGTEVTGMVSRTVQLLKKLRPSGYDILRDDELHTRSDRMLLDFLARVGEKAGARLPEKDRVPVGAIGTPAAPARAQTS